MSSELIFSRMSCARGSLGLRSTDWSAVTMHAVSANADKDRTSVPANPERRRESGWTTLDKIRLPNATVDLGKHARSPMVRTFINLRHDYVFASKYVKRKGLCCK